MKRNRVTGVGIRASTNVESKAHNKARQTRDRFKLLLEGPFYFGNREEPPAGYGKHAQEEKRHALQAGDKCLIHTHDRWADDKLMVCNVVKVTKTQVTVKHPTGSVVRYYKDRGDEYGKRSESSLYKRMEETLYAFDQVLVDAFVDMATWAKRAKHSADMYLNGIDNMLAKIGDLDAEQVGELWFVMQGMLADNQVRKEKREAERGW